MIGGAGRTRGAILSIAIVAVVALFSLVSRDYFSVTNFRTVLESMALVCVMGLGVTFVLTTGEIDISNGAMLSVPACVMAVLLRSGSDAFIAIGIALAVTVLLGFINGFFTIRVGLPSFITTLGVSGIAMGMSRIVTSSAPVPVKNDFILQLFGQDLLGVPKIILWMLLLLTIGYFLLHRTRFGKNLHCIGDNREAATLYGINVRRDVIIAFIVCSIFVFFGGMLQMGRSSYASPGAGESLVLNAIVASVIGGTSVQGGKGSMIGTFTGAIFLTLISSGLFMLATSPYITNITIGVIIIAVLTVNGLIEKRNLEWKRK
jgi:ribose/xylose/arabinose/galactoside ABC-type transport system permease subunit